MNPIPEKPFPMGPFASPEERNKRNIEMREWDEKYSGNNFIHQEPHPRAGKTVKVNFEGTFQAYRIEDWWDRLGQGSWMTCDGNPACLKYAVRGASVNTPTDNEVVYGKIKGIGHLIHAIELGADLTEDETLINTEEKVKGQAG